MGYFTAAKVIELRIYDDPANPDTSGYRVALPMTLLEAVADAGTAASKNTGVAAGNVPLLDANGKLEESVLPPIAVVDVVAAASEADMLALTGLQTGDMCVRTDSNEVYVLAQLPASTLENWLQIQNPNAVLSVNGMTGVVTVTDITGNAATATALAANGIIDCGTF
jgi:hypothetical protein